MEIALDEFHDFVGRIFYVTTQGAVAEGAELGDDAVDHSGAEHTVLLVHGTLTLQAGSRSHTRVGQLVELCQTVGVLGIVDIDIDVGAFGHIESIGHLETVTAGDSFTGSFVGSILNGKTVPEAHRIAVQVSAYVCTQNGAMPPLPAELLK